MNLDYKQKYLKYKKKYLDLKKIGGGIYSKEDVRPLFFDRETSGPQKKMKALMGCPAFGHAHKECNEAREKAFEIFNDYDRGRSWVWYNLEAIEKKMQDYYNRPLSKSEKADVIHMVNRINKFIEHINENHPDAWTYMDFDLSTLLKINGYNKMIKKTAPLPKITYPANHRQIFEENGYSEFTYDGYIYKIWKEDDW